MAWTIPPNWDPPPTLKVRKPRRHARESMVTRWLREEIDWLRQLRHEIASDRLYEVDQRRRES